MLSSVRTLRTRHWVNGSFPPGLSCPLAVVGASQREQRYPLLFCFYFYFYFLKIKVLGPNCSLASRGQKFDPRCVSLFFIFSHIITEHGVTVLGKTCVSSGFSISKAHSVHLLRRPIQLGEVGPVSTKKPDERHHPPPHAPRHPRVRARSGRRRRRRAPEHNDKDPLSLI